jgi:hypothetical protein
MLAACTQPVQQPDIFEATTPDGSQVQVSLRFPVSSCPTGMAAPCYEYTVRLTPQVPFSPTYVVPSSPPSSSTSPVPADSLLARLERLLRRARLAGDSINKDGVNRYIELTSKGAFSTLCALRMAVEPPAYGRVVIRFIDQDGRSRFQRDPESMEEQTLSPGLTDRADLGVKMGEAWVWQGRFADHVLPIGQVRHGMRIEAWLEPACRSLELPE